MRLLGSFLTTAVLLATLTACAQPDPPITRAWAPASTPVFASEEDALAAAEEAYALYLEMSDLIASEGGANPERLAALVTKAQFAIEEQGFALYQDNQWVTTGHSKFDQFTLQSYSPSDTGANALAAYLCYDATALRIIDDAGVDVSPESVPLRQTLEVFFVTEGPTSNRFLIESAGIWDSSSC